MVDVKTEITIECPVEKVAEYAGNPENAPTWYVNIKEANWKTDKPLRIGSQIAFVAFFLRKRLEYTYEIVELQPLQKLVMRTAEGPFPMETTYTWEKITETQTRMTLRNAGEPSGFSKLFAPIMASQMRKANNKDLKLLKEILEKG